MSDQNTPPEAFDGSSDPASLGSPPPSSAPQFGPPPPGASPVGPPLPGVRPSGGSIPLGIGIGALGGLASWGLGTLSGRMSPGWELLTQLLGVIAGLIPIALVILGIVLSVMPATRRTGAGVLLSFGIGILIAGGVCVALLAGVLVG